MVCGELCFKDDSVDTGAAERPAGVVHVDTSDDTLPMWEVPVFDAPDAPDAPDPFYRDEEACPGEAHAAAAASGDGGEDTYHADGLVPVPPPSRFRRCLGSCDRWRRLARFAMRLCWRKVKME